MVMNTYLIRKEWMSLGDDFVINSTEEDGEALAFSVDNKILNLRETYHMSDAEGNIIYKIMERNIPNKRVIIYDDAEEKVAVVRKRGDGSYWAHIDDERDIIVEGDAESGTGLIFKNLGGLNIARMTDAWLFSLADMKQMDIRADQDDSLLMAVATACQYLAGDDGDDDDDDEEQVGMAAIMFAGAYLLRNAWLGIGDDFVVNKIGGEDVGWYVNHKAFRRRQRYHLENEDGDTILTIRERTNPRHRMIIEDADGEKVAVVRKRGDGTYWCHVDDDRDIFAEGDGAEGRLELSNIGGLNVASLAPSEASLFPDGDGFNMVRIRPDQEEDLIIAVLVAVQYLTEDDGDDESDGESEGEED